MVERAARALVGMKRLAQDPEGYRRPDHASSAFAGGDARKLVLELLQQRGLEPPWVMDVAAETKLAEKALRELLAIMAKSNEVVRATSELYFARSAFDGGAAVLAEWFATKIDLSTQDAKNLLGLSRKYLIPLLESYDKLGVTVRVGEVRRAKGAKKVSS